jgi:ribosomal-protein-alanine N-acetyltransferase
MNTLYSVRPACSDDLEQMLVIEQSSYPEPWSYDHFISELQKPYARVLVLTDDETDSIVLGYIVYWLQAEGASLLNICVNPKWRNLGFSKLLMRTLINEVVREEIPTIHLEVRESNAAAIALYQSLNFKQTHTREHFYRDGENALVMEIKTSDLSPSIH